MNETNLALVRAMKKPEFIQLLRNNGILYSLSCSVVLKKPKSLIGNFERAISDLEEVKYKEFYDYEEYARKYGKEYEELYGVPFNRFGYNVLVDIDRTRQKLEFFQDLLPLHLEYNSVILFSINGLVPDDIEGGAFANNTFSTDKFAVVFGLADVLENVQMASIVATDTAIKEKVALPNDACIFIDEQEYSKLSYEDKEKLSQMRLYIFNTTLKDAVSKFLRESERYTAEVLSLTRQEEGYKESDTKKEVVEAIHATAQTYQIPQRFHFDYALNEAEEYSYIYNYIRNEFFRYLKKKNIMKFNFSDLIKYDSLYYYEGFVEKIKGYGVEQYWKLIKRFNGLVIDLNKQGKVPTPKKLIEAWRNDEEISIVEDILVLEASLDRE